MSGEVTLRSCLIPLRGMLATRAMAGMAMPRGGEGQLKGSVAHIGRMPMPLTGRWMFLRVEGG